MITVQIIKLLVKCLEMYWHYKSLVTYITVCPAFWQQVSFDKLRPENNPAPVTQWRGLKLRSDRILLFASTSYPALERITKL